MADPAAAVPPPAAAAGVEEKAAAAAEDVGKLPLKELRRRLAVAGVDYGGFLEKREFVDAVRALPAAGVAAAGAANGGGGGAGAPGRIQRDPVPAASGCAAVLQRYQNVEDLGALVVVGTDESGAAVNVEVRNDQLVALSEDATLPGAEQRICEQLWRLLPKQADTPVGPKLYIGVAAAVPLPADFAMSNVAVPAQADNLPADKSLRVFAFDEQLALGYTEADGVTPRFHFDVAALRGEPGFRVAKAFFDMKCVAAQLEGGGELSCSEFLEASAAQGTFGLGPDAVVLGMTACRVLGLIIKPPLSVAEAAAAAAAANDDVDAGGGSDDGDDCGGDEDGEHGDGGAAAAAPAAE